MAESQVYLKAQRGEGFSFNMTPMIDVTFQLIIFFILAGQIASSELAQLLLHRPHDSQALDKDEYRMQRVVINVVSQAPSDRTKAESISAFLAAQAREYRVSGESKAIPVMGVGSQQALVNALKRQKKAKQGDTSDDEFYVEIRSDYRISYAQVEPVMIAAAEAGFKKMNITALVKLAEGK